LLGTVIYGKDEKGKKIENGLFELTNHALVKKRKQEGLVDKQTKKDKIKLKKEKKIWKAKVAAERQKAHDNFSDSDESSEEEQDSSTDSDDEVNLPYLDEALEVAKKRFEAIDTAGSSLDIPGLEEKAEIGPDGNALLDCLVEA